jgi:heme oxygenase
MAAFLDAAQGVLGDEDWLAGARNAIAQDLGRAPPRTGHLRDAQDTATLAGWRYVVAGSSLGARVLLREAGRLAAAATRGTAPLRTTFLSSFAAGDAWPRCLDELRNARFDAAGQARACDAALEAFRAAEAAMIQARNTLHAA